MDAKIGPDPANLNEKLVLHCNEGFHGFRSIKHDKDMIDLARVDVNTSQGLM